MAKPITNVVKPIMSEKEKQQQSLDHVVQDLAQNADGIRETIQLLQELHESGVLEGLNSLLKAKEDVAKIAVGQMTRPPVTNAINNAVAAAGVLTELDPQMTKKLTRSVANGLQKAEEGLQADTKVGILDIMKALKDPDINRAVGFGLNLLKGVGEGLKEK
ncbi:DUF1641 domain-containing protein [Ectobacillus panaciterrae]|uniref:DUF1641 domain-containing protein n=1 Tax=Ectobacillus panaciterrae TaxID=363872 RepID=UPI00041039EF|nr:DUF1641 domain-containing protein [Ectobacillus panaciterrae]